MSCGLTFVIMAGAHGGGDDRQDVAGARGVLELAGLPGCEADDLGQEADHGAAGLTGRDQGVDVLGPGLWHSLRPWRLAGTVRYRRWSRGRGGPWP
jgi:hypothetical protein